MDFKIEGEYIELIKLLKACGAVESGAMAKIVVEDGEVEVNGEQEFRKRKKLYRNDRVHLFDLEITIS